MRNQALVMIFVLSVASAQAEVPVRSVRSLRVQFDSYTELLKKEILFNRDKDKKSRFSLLNQALEQMKILREEVGPSENPDAAHMDQVIASLDALPSKKQFKKKNCSEYQANVATIPGNELAAEFINSVCN